ncbi:MAG: GPP34 family phosphoprotein [Dactylosporangium sp.]|nr:GPP34 family phosphoprotein [Dactylosporangium sp.]NNJ63910.1 GPP34 family phosphoprotein [Dactylosporangium sp.]
MTGDPFHHDDDQGAGAHHRRPQDSPLGEEPSSLAADLFLIMLDDASGRLRVHPRIVGFCLVAALLVELWMGGHLVLARGRVSVVGGRPLPEDALLRGTLGWLLTDPDQAECRPWVEALAATAVDRMARHLEAGGWIRLVERRRLTGQAVVYEPIDRNRVFWRTGRLTSALANGPTWSDVFLFVLVDAAGFTPALLVDSASPPTRERLTAVVDRLGQVYPDVADLAGVVRALTDRVATAPRR